MGSRHGPAVHQPEETRQSQVGYDDHHAQKKRDRVEVDRSVGVLDWDDAEGHHQARAKECRTGPIDLETGQLADGNDDVGHDEDEDRGDPRRIVGPGDRRQNAVTPNEPEAAGRDDAARNASPQQCTRRTGFDGSGVSRVLRYVDPL